MVAEPPWNAPQCLSYPDQPDERHGGRGSSERRQGLACAVSSARIRSARWARKLRLESISCSGRRSAGEPRCEAIEDSLEAEFEGIVGSRAVFGGGCVQSGAQPRELHRDLAGLRHAVAHDLLGISALALEPPGE